MPKISKATRVATDTAPKVAARNTDINSARLASDVAETPAVPKAQQTQELAAAMPINGSKSKESGFIQAQAARREDSPPSGYSGKAGKDETAKEDGVHRVAIDREHAVVTSVNPIPATDQLPDLSASQARREGRIRLAAYALSERRGFLPGFEIQDWLEAERQIDMEADLHAATEKAA